MRKLEHEAPLPGESIVSAAAAACVPSGTVSFHKALALSLQFTFPHCSWLLNCSCFSFGKEGHTISSSRIKVSNLIWCSLLWASHWPFLALLTLCWSTPLPRLSSGHLSSCSCVSTSRSPIASHVSMPSPSSVLVHEKKGQQACGKSCIRKNISLSNWWLELASEKCFSVCVDMAPTASTRAIRKRGKSPTQESAQRTSTTQVTQMLLDLKSFWSTSPIFSCF